MKLLLLEMRIKCFKLVVLSILALLSSCNAFPEDLKPSLILGKKAASKLPVFNGATLPTDEERLMDIQEIKVIDDTVLIGCRNAVYVISTNSFSQATGYIEYDQMLPWNSSENDKLCQEMTSSKRSCHNYIRVIARVRTNAVLLCGTNAAGPSCREYKWQQSQFPKIGGYSDVIERLNLPRNDAVTLAYRYTDGYLYSATTWDAGGLHRGISRSDVAAEETRYLQSFLRAVEMEETLTTDEEARPSWLNDPQFVGMIDSPEKVYVFFREEAEDASDATEKVVFSRVARVCKQDRGGSANVLKGKWSSFFKARLNCSISGNRPFYFNEIQHVTGPVVLNGTKMVFATMTTPENSISGSAVCAFTLYEIERVMAGNYKEQDPSSSCWKRRIPNYPNPLPSICASHSKNLDNERLQFVKTHSLMSDSVRAVDGKPLFMATQTRTRFTSIAVETDVVVANGDRVTVMYIGTRNGKLIKVTTSQEPAGRQRRTTFSEEWDVYQRGACSRTTSSQIATSDSLHSGDAGDGVSNEPEEMRVRNVALLPSSDVILVTFQHCVISLPQQACYHYKSNVSCIQSGNPYCGWYDDYCSPLTSENRAEIQQELFRKEKTTNKITDVFEEANFTNFEKTPQLVNSIDKETGASVGVVLPLVLGLVSTFSLVLLLFLLMICCKNKSSGNWCFFSAGVKCAEGGKLKTCDPNERQSGNTQFFVHNSNEDLSHVTVGVRSTTEPLIKNRPEIGSPHLVNTSNENPSLGAGARDKILVVQNIANESHYNSGEETTWSEDFFDSDRSVSDLHLATKLGTCIQSTDGGTESSQRNRAVGIAHPISQRSNKVLQVVKPTFVANAGLKVKLGSKGSMESYGAIQPTERSEQSRATPSRIMTNPNYLPVTPCIQRNVDAANTQEDVRRDKAMKTFSPVVVSPRGEKKKLVPDNSCNFDLKFPPPPACVLSPSNEHVKLESFTAPLSSTRRFPSPPGKNQLPPPRPKTDDSRLTPVTAKPPTTHEDKSPSDILPSSASGDSSSSGFVSSSPRSSLKDASGADRKACIVAKGILSAQTTLASPNMKRSKSKKKKLQELERKSEDVENIYDEVFEDMDPANRSSTLPRRFSQRTSDCLHDYDEISYQSPEFCRSSEDEEDCDDAKSCARTPGDGYTLTDEESRSKKKPLRLFRLSKKSKKSKKMLQLMQNDENFVSPSYDEEPVVPIVEGWEEIDYSSGAIKDDDQDCSVDLRRDSPRFYDDSDIPMNTKFDNVQAKEKFGFHTMRPKNRMRQKMPKMRNTGKKWSLTNNPLPIPTPAVPEA